MGCIISSNTVKPASNNNNNNNNNIVITKPREKSRVLDETSPGPNGNNNAAAELASVSYPEWKLIPTTEEARKRYEADGSLAKNSATGQLELIN